MGTVAAANAGFDGPGRERARLARKGFVGSPEFQRLLPDRSDRTAVTAVVTRLDNEILGRAPDPAGLDNWKGIPRRHLTDTVQAGFVSSGSSRARCRSSAGVEPRVSSALCPARRCALTSEAG